MEKRYTACPMYISLRISLHIPLLSRVSVMRFLGQSFLKTHTDKQLFDICK